MAVGSAVTATTCAAVRNAPAADSTGFLPPERPKVLHCAGTAHARNDRARVVGAWITSKLSSTATPCVSVATSGPPDPAGGAGSSAASRHDTRTATLICATAATEPGRRHAPSVTGSGHSTPQRGLWDPSAPPATGRCFVIRAPARPVSKSRCLSAAPRLESESAAPALEPHETTSARPAGRRVSNTSRRPACDAPSPGQHSNYSQARPATSLNV